MELYGCFVPAPILFPVACLGLTAQYVSLRELWFPSTPLLLPRAADEGEATGWAGCPPDLLALVFARLSSSLLIRCGSACELRLVCRSWRRVYDARAAVFLKPAMFYADAIAQRFPALLSLDLSRCKYPSEISLRFLLTHLRHLECLTLKDVGCGPRLAATLAESLVATGRLRSINLSSNGIASRGAASFAAALQLNCCSLTALNLRDNQITVEGATSLARALESNCSLADLDLSSNPGIGHDGAAALGAALQRNGTLSRLNLGGCGLGDAGAVELASCLAGARGLRSLSLYSNDISDAGCAQLAQGAGRSDLTSLELRGNPRIGPAGVRALAAAARANRSLREVHVQTQPGAKRVYAEATEAEEAARLEMEAVTAALAAVLLPRAPH